MTLLWRVFAKLFPKEYDVLFDVMHDYHSGVELGYDSEFTDESVKSFWRSVEELGVRMGCWSKDEMIVG